MQLDCSPSTAEVNEHTEDKAGRANNKVNVNDKWVHNLSGMRHFNDMVIDGRKLTL